MNITLKDLTIAPPEPSKADWNENGFVIMQQLISEPLMDEYEKCWLRNNVDRPRGWDYCTPYRNHSEVLDILSHKGLHNALEALIGEPAGVHLNLTGWVTTTRDWHQDTYLNPPHVGDYYAAVWIALDTIHPDSGPFQMVPGSHRWPVVTQEKIINALEPHERNHYWPTHSERILTPLFTEEIKKRNAEIKTYLPKRGDVLFWHGRLLHRGSLANVPGMRRKALIAHYSGINHRQDMPPAQKYKNGWYFPVDDINRSLK